MVKNVNTFLRAVGTGAFHTGVEVYGKEWSFGFTNDGSSGIFSCPPRCCKTHAYREAIPMGETFMSQVEVEALLVRLEHDWRGAQYDVLRRNCTHFSEEFCRKLGVGPVPRWVGNIALAGRTVDIGIQRVASFRSVHTARSMGSPGPKQQRQDFGVGLQGSQAASTVRRSPFRPRTNTRHRSRSAGADLDEVEVSDQCFSPEIFHSVKSVPILDEVHSMKSVKGFQNAKSLKN